MRHPVIVDTNVPVVANQRNTHADAACTLACIEALETCRVRGPILLDEIGLILEEYQSHLSHSGQPGPGDAFFKWLWNNQGNTTRCIRVSITRCGPDDTDFAEFPGDPDLAAFDPSDRKFVAVALASGESPEVLNATDTDWWEHRAALERNGVRIRFLCPQHMAAP